MNLPPPKTQVSLSYTGLSIGLFRLLCGIVRHFGVIRSFVLLGLLGLLGLFVYLRAGSNIILNSHKLYNFSNLNLLIAESPNKHNNLNIAAHLNQACI